jgi:membrane protein
VLSKIDKKFTGRLLRSSNLLAKIKKLVQSFLKAEIPLIASSLSYSTLLSLVPFLAVTFSAFNYSVDLQAFEPKVREMMMSVFKDTAGSEVAAQLQEILQRISTAEWGLWSAAALFFTSYQIFDSVHVAVNRIWGHRGERPLWKRFLLFLTFFILAPLSLAVFAGVIEPIFSGLRGIGIAILSFAGLLFINKVLPATKVHWRVAMLASIVSALCFFILETSFATVAKMVFNYNKIYGSIAAIPLFCLLIQIAWYIVLLGVLLASELQRGDHR